MNRRDFMKLTGMATASRANINWVMLIYFCSGACSLIDEVVWVRLLKLTLGNTVYASSIVVSMFMGGLALGALIMSRFADRIKRPLRLYTLLEVCATLSALSLPFVLRLADAAYRWYFVKFEPSPSELMIVQVLLSAAILLVPAMVMGSTLPLLGRYITQLKKQVGHLVGRLYALNTLGAALGCFLAGYVLVRLAGVMGTLYIAAAINMLVACGGAVLSRYHDIIEKPQEVFEPVPQEEIAIEHHGKGTGFILILAFFVSGLISIGYELIWMRSIVIHLGGFTYVFAAVLTMYLLGNVIGAWIGSRLSKRLKQPAAGFGISLSCLGLSGIFYIPSLVLWASQDTVSTFGRQVSSSAILFMVSPLFHCAFLFLLPSIIMGIGFPLALQSWSNRDHRTGQTTGTVYGANTIGAVAGGIVTGFVLIPLLGVQLSIVVLGLLGLWLGTGMIQVFLSRYAFKWKIGWAVTAVGLSILVLSIPQDLFKRHLVKMQNTKLIDVKEGLTTTVSVHETARGELILATSGLQVGGDSLRGVQQMLGHLGLLLNQNTKTVLSVGFGTGETTACMAQHNTDRVDCVEISPELAEVALKRFRHINLGERLDDEINMIFMDAKNYLHLTPKRYDLIVNDSIDPVKFADNASLYTEEYFRNARDRLMPGGMFASYLPYGAMPVSSTDSILGTFVEVFPYVTIWFPVTAPGGHKFFYLAGSLEPQKFSPEYIDNILQQEGVRNTIGTINFYNSHYVLSCYIGDQDDLKRYLGGFHPNTDLKPFVEFNIERGMGASKWLAKFTEKLKPGSIFKHLDWKDLAPEQKEKWIQDFKSYSRAASALLAAQITKYPLFQLYEIYDVLELMPNHVSLLEQQNYSLYLSKSIMNSPSLDVTGFISNADELLEIHPEFGAGWLVKSMALQKQNKEAEALDAGKKAVQYAPYIVEAHYNLGTLLVKFRKTKEAVLHYRKALELARAAGNNEMVQKIQARLQHFNALQKQRQ
jgi:spermidine synthase